MVKRKRSQKSYSCVVKIVAKELKKEERLLSKPVGRQAWNWYVESLWNRLNGDFSDRECEKLLIKALKSLKSKKSNKN